MAASILDIGKEKARQNLYGDTLFYKKKPYVFVLRGPKGQGSFSFEKGEAVFPMVLNPTVFEYTLPFASRVTPLQEGGVVSDEQGILVGDILLEATTGFKLKQPLDTSFSPVHGQFTGNLDSLIVPSNAYLSGQMLFWRLANRCFEAYSELKKNPDHSPKTLMEFHSLGDDLHLIVVPQEFKLDRNASRDRVTYRFTTRLSVVGRTDETVNIPSPDVSLFKKFKNTIGTIRSTVQSVRATVDDVTASMDELRRAVTSIAGIIDDVASILDACDDFLTGAKLFIAVPSAFISSTAELLESAANLFTNVASFPADVAQSCLNIADDLDRLKVAARDHFRDSLDEISRRYDRLTSGKKEGDDLQLDQDRVAKKDEADSAQGRMSVSNAFSGVKPGDLARSRMEPFSDHVRMKPGFYSGFEERVVGHGDSIQSLAAKHLGNARDWLELVSINQLKPPYITNGPRLPGTLRVGDRIVVPARATLNSPNTLSTGSKETGSSQIDAHLGRDFELRQLSNGKYGWAIDSASGGTDVYHVQGVPNLGQNVVVRLMTEQGQNILYPNLGLPRVIGVKNLGEVLVQKEYEARNQILADPRVSKLNELQFTLNEDVLEVRASIVPVGFTSARTISRTLT